MDINILISTTTLMALVICLYESLTVCKKTYQYCSKRSIIVLDDDLLKAFLQKDAALKNELHGKVEILLTDSIKKVIHMLGIILGVIFLAFIIYVKEGLTGFKNDTCPACKRKFTLKIIYPDPNNAKEVEQAKCMRKRCAACGHVIETPCDFREDGKIGQGLYKCTGKVLKMIGKW